MSDPAVLVEGVGKRYRLRHHHGGGGYQTLRETLASFAAAPFRRLKGSNQPRVTTDDFWALQDVSFSVSEGEVVGIIGRNGAGKSTLLKILSRITEPTTGRVTLSGRVASLLEVGTGFHPELSGRDNIYLNAAILGMARAETARKFDEIVAFAEVEQFLDTPVKRYSSGMYVRLAFAVAAHLDPEILIVDEVLAVGDAEFQKRCIGKMHEVSRGGRTVLFVSHNMAAIQALCNRGIWVEKGRIARDGAVREVIGQYLSHSAAGSRVSSGGAIPVSPSLELSEFEVSPNPVESAGAITFRMTLRASAATRVNEAALLVYSAQETRLAIVDLRPAGLPAALTPGETLTIRGRIESLPLVEGEYSLGAGLTTSEFAGDKLRLFELTVAARPSIMPYAPYAAAHRGVVELDSQVESSRGRLSR
jgi:lipopolysaccharide transport system ATP-binding protein